MIVSIQPPIKDMVKLQDAPITTHAQTQSHSTTMQNTMAFLNTSNGSQYQLLINQTVLSQYITTRITHGTLHHHGTPKKTSNPPFPIQKITKIIEIHSEVIHHEK